MNGKNAALLIELALALTIRLQEIQLLFQKAAVEGRDVTDEEIAEFRSKDDAAAKALDIAIAQKREREAATGG